MARSHAENLRAADLLRLLPDDVDHLVDVGAHDGFLTTQLADRVRRVTAVDAAPLAINDCRISCVRSDATALGLRDRACDLVLCAETLEHIGGDRLDRACSELVRVSRRYLLIGVPYAQDTRVGRTTCAACGKTNPPWGHVNTFDRARLLARFPGCAVLGESYVGAGARVTNSVSAALLDLAGNPYGTYSQREPCVHCGAPLGGPRSRSLVAKVLTRLAVRLDDAQNACVRPRANWMHLLLGPAASVSSMDRSRWSLGGAKSGRLLV